MGIHEKADRCTLLKLDDCLQKVFFFEKLHIFTNAKDLMRKTHPPLLPLVVACLTLIQGYAENVDLQNFEERVFSQQGEDGVINKILSVIGTDSKFCVEFGGYDGIQTSNTRRLLMDEGWKGALFDGSHHNPDIDLYQEFITAENITAVFERYAVPPNLDLLSIDIDYNDFHVWRALDRKYRPRLVVIEYNATFLPTEDRVVPYDPYAIGDGTNYFGASILAYFILARSMGYSLVYAEKMGVNLFFVRDDLLESAEDKFKNVNEVSLLYMSPKYGTGPNGGHPQDPFNRPYTSAKELLALE